MLTAELLDSSLYEIPGYDPREQGEGCEYSQPHADAAVEFIETLCTHVKGEWAGTKMLLENWQKAIIENLFGWRRKSNGTRRYRECLVYIPRKNGKTILAAAIVNYMLFYDDEPGAEIYSSAAERDQARLCFDVTKGMIVNSRSLSDAAEVFKYAITSGDKSYKAISAEASTKHGYNLSTLLNDELHAHKTAELTEVLMTATGARRQPLIVHLTTADYDRESICNQKYGYACNVRDGVIEDPAFLPVIYEATLEDDWTDPAVWAMANPNYDVSISSEYLARECKRAQDQPAFENTFKRLHLNIRTKTDVRWLNTQKWDDCEIVDRDDLKGRTCFGGLDLSSCRDLTAFVMWFPNDDDTHTIIPTFWIPEDIIRERSNQDGVNYDVWLKKGWMRKTPGDTIDYREVRKDIDELGNIYGIQKIAVDRLFQGEETAQELANMGFDVEAFGQGFYSMAAPTKRFDELYHSGKLKHDGNPVMRWMIHNVSVEIDAAGNMKPSKKKSSEKIDGVVSALMAEGLWMSGERPVESVYATRGMLTL